MWFRSLSDFWKCPSTRIPVARKGRRHTEAEAGAVVVFTPKRSHLELRKVLALLKHNTLFQQLYANLDEVGVVHRQYYNRSTTDGRFSDQVSTAPLKMPLPFMAPRMKEFCQLLGNRVNAGNIGSLVGVAVQA